MSDHIPSILVPLDGSDLAETIVPLVGRLASTLRATVSLLHVLEHDAPSQVHGAQHLADVPTAQGYLDRIATRLRDAGVSAVELHVHENPEHDVAAAIVQHAIEFHAELVVLANHGGGGWREFFFGTIAQQVIRLGETPVVAVPVRTAAADIPSAGLETITVALDGTDEAEAALAPTSWIAERYGAPVHIVAAVETTGTLTGDERALATMIPSATRAVLNLQVEETQAYLDEVVAMFRARNVPATSALLRGAPADVIVAEAKRVQSGLLVLATHGRSGLSGIWAGSVGSRILATYGAPLLLVHAPELPSD